MHVLAGSSALRALRAVRYRGLAVALPSLTMHNKKALLPGQIEASPPPEDSDYFPDGRTLQESGFPFAEVETNTQVDLWQLGELGPFTEERQLELAVFDRRRRVWNKKSRTRFLPQTLPEGSLIQVNPYLYFVCPEIAVLQMAASLDALQLAKVIMELCGSYTLHPEPHSRAGAHFQLPPVTTLGRVRRYSELWKMRGGTRTLHDALDIAIPGSASPGETILALVMSLPAESGGYGFGKPALNASVTVPDDLQECVGGRSYFLDAYWEGAFTDLEYESTNFHLDPAAAASLVTAQDGGLTTDPEASVWLSEYITKADADRRRVRDLQFLGLSVIPVTAFDLREVRRMDQVACALAKNYAMEQGLDFTNWFARLSEHTYREERIRLLRALADEGV